MLIGCLQFPLEFGIGQGENMESPFQQRDSWLVGLVNAGPYIGSAFIGCWLSDPVNVRNPFLMQLFDNADPSPSQFYFGRRGTIFISAIFCVITPIGGALSQTWEQLFITRLLMGIGMGLKGSTVPIFAAENSPAKIRGALVMSWQMWTAFGKSHRFDTWCIPLTCVRRHLPGLLRQPRRLQGRRDCLAPPDWICLHPCCTTYHRHLLLP